MDGGHLDMIVALENSFPAFVSLATGHKPTPALLAALTRAVQPFDCVLNLKSVTIFCAFDVTAPATSVLRLAQATFSQTHP